MKNFNYDYSEFDPNATTHENVYPPAGDYNLCLMATTAFNKSSDGKFTKVVGEPYEMPDAVSFDFEVSDGERQGAKFSMWYNIKHEKPIVSKIAFENIGKIYWAATGIKPDSRGIDDITKAFFKRFTATLEKSVKDGKEYHSLKGIKPIQVQGNTPSTNAGANPAWGQ